MLDEAPKAQRFYVVGQYSSLLFKTSPKYLSGLVCVVWSLPTFRSCLSNVQCKEGIADAHLETLRLFCRYHVRE